ncbi:MAG: M6 family metalloprotease domain-containing protein [Bacteroidota bacterium]
MITRPEYNRKIRAGLSILLLSGLLVCSMNAQQVMTTVKSPGMPSYPFPVRIEQADGSAITVSGRGNRMIHWYETADQYTVLKDKDGNFVYGKRDAEGNLVPTQIKVTEYADNVPSGTEKNLRFSKSQVEMLKQVYNQDEDVKANPNPFPSTGINRVLVILVDFPDRPSTHEATELEALLNEPGYNGIGSFRDYYLDVSYNQLEINATVIPWVHATQNMSYYGENDEYGYDLRPQELVRDAVDQAEAAGVDFSQFDNNGDGYIDDLILFHAGFGEQYPGAGDTCIWSHAFHLGDLSVEYDGVRIDNYLICPELYGNSGSNLTSIGTVVHEFAHSLAIPDLNDEDFDESGGYAFDLNFWDLMAVGSWNNEGATPAGINAWLKRYMGWMSIPEIDATGVYTLQSAISHQEAYQINTPVYNEYYILENRQWDGFDDYLPGHGLLIYHVDMNYPGWLTGEVNVDPSHQGFDIEEADDIRDTITLPGDPFPGTDGVTAFDAATQPGSNTWNGEASNVSIQNISENDGIISFEVVGTNYDALPDEWTIDPLTFTQFGLITAQVIIGTDTMNSGYLSAFVNGECRGIAPVTYHTETNDYLFELQVYSNAVSGEQISFNYYDPVADSIYALYETISFTTGTIAGSTLSPYRIHTPVKYTRSFITGWNWFSMNITLNNMAPGNLLPACTAAGDYIKNQTRSTTYYAGYGWFGTLSVLNNTSLFFLNAKSACTMNLTGLAVQPEANPISLVAGWNWVAYSPQVSLAPGTALASMTPANLDYVKNQTRSTTYYTGYGWFGTLSLMNPGEGYMMRLAHSDVLTYPAASASGKKTASAETEVSNPRLNPYLYQYNGTISARILSDGATAGEEGDILYAWVGDECRGASAGLYFPPTGEVIFPLMVYSNTEEGEEMSFTCYDRSEDMEYRIGESIGFEKDIVLADAMQPFDMNIYGRISGTLDPAAEGPALSIWPNPFKESLHISFTVKEKSSVTIEIYDLYGKLIDRISEGTYDPGSYSLKWNKPGTFSGACLLKMNCGNTVLTQRIIHLD